MLKGCGLTTVEDGLIFVEEQIFFSSFLVTSTGNTFVGVFDV